MSEAEGEQEEPKNFLKQETITENLSQIDTTSAGDTYAFTTLILEEKEVELLGDAIKAYIHLRNINLNKNQLKSIDELSCLNDLLILTAIENQIEDISFLAGDVLPHLQILNLSQNKIKNLPPIHAPMLKHLILNENEIESWAEFTGHKNLTILELRKNKLINWDGLGNMPNLRELYLAENPLVSIGQLHTLSNLKRLHIRGCEIEKFEMFPDLPRLEYFNMRETKIASLEDLKKIEIWENIKFLNMQASPVSDELGDGIKKELILLFPEIEFEKINKDALTQEDYTEAEELRQERIREEEEKRRAAEAEGEEKADE